MGMTQRQFNKKLRDALEKSRFNSGKVNVEALHEEADRILEETVKSFGLKLNLYNDMKSNKGGFWYP